MIGLSGLIVINAEDRAKMRTASTNKRNSDALRSLGGVCKWQANPHAIFTPRYPLIHKTSSNEETSVQHFIGHDRQKRFVLFLVGECNICTALWVTKHGYFVSFFWFPSHTPPKIPRLLQLTLHIKNAEIRKEYAWYHKDFGTFRNGKKRIQSKEWVIQLTFLRIWIT